MASKRRLRRRACDGKVRFANVHIAGKVAREMRERHHERLQRYKCPHCKGWHIGHA